MGNLNKKFKWYFTKISLYQLDFSFNDSTVIVCLSHKEMLSSMESCVRFSIWHEWSIGVTHLKYEPPFISRPRDFIFFWLIEKYFSEEGEDFLGTQMFFRIFLHSWNLKNISISKKCRMVVIRVLGWGEKGICGKMVQILSVANWTSFGNLFHNSVNVLNTVEPCI